MIEDISAQDSLGRINQQVAASINAVQQDHVDVCHNSQALGSVEGGQLVFDICDQWDAKYPKNPISNEKEHDNGHEDDES